MKEVRSSEARPLEGRALRVLVVDDSAVVRQVMVWLPDQRSPPRGEVSSVDHTERVWGSDKMS